MAITGTVLVQVVGHNPRPGSAKNSPSPWLSAPDMRASLSQANSARPAHTAVPTAVDEGGGQALVGVWVQPPCDTYPARALPSALDDAVEIVQIAFVTAPLPHPPDTRGTAVEPWSR